MNRTITSEILVSYSQCPRKAYLLLCTNQGGIHHEYVRILQQRKEALQREYIKELKQKNPDVQSYSLENLKSRSDFLVNAKLKAEGLEAECGILTKADGSSSLGRYRYEPTIFIGTYRIDKYQKLELFFVGHVLEQIQSKQPAVGRIVGVGGRSHRVKLENSSKTLVPLLVPLQEWLETSSPEPPPLILNKHCSLCQFRSMCRVQADQEDNLSLLDAISTPKTIRRYEKKGIFTVEQLSYTFKPRKRRKRAKNPQTAHKPELQALAIRTGKIYLQELTELSRQPCEMFLDIEGIPDQGSYYLIGLLVCEADISKYHSFWSDNSQNEAQIWRQFLKVANKYPDAPIYHYGSYESKAINGLARQYETDSEDIKKRLANVNTWIHSKVYFPTRSNNLKELGKFVGASWTSPDASGLQTLVWRHYWEETQDTKYRKILLTYNEEDCRALKQLTDELSRIKHSADVMSEVDFADHPKMSSTEFGKAIYDQFEIVLKSASIDYERNKISFRQLERKKNKQRTAKKNTRRTRRSSYQKYIDAQRKATKVIRVSQREVCPKCGYEHLQPTRLLSERVIVDLVSTENGIMKTITKYEGVKGYCPRCHKHYLASDISDKYKVGQLYGYGFRAWVIYHRVALRLPYESIIESLKEHFDEEINTATLPWFIQKCADYYAETEEMITQRLLDSPIIHIDETQMIVESANWYVWVLTNEEYVIFKLRESRETAFLHEFLAGYQGVLVSDFYSGYDSVPCRQQKCWVHLIRDINNDLRENPFDEEFETFVMRVRNLIVPIIEMAQEYGLKKRKLNRFRWPVIRFYQNVITDKHYKSELVIKYQKRFIRYRESLFTFLEEDGIPWHNNAAERAIRHVAIQRDISRTSLSKSTTQNYLVLLGIRQTLRFQGKSFFKFLFSGEKDIDQSMGPRRARK